MNESKNPIQKVWFICGCAIVLGLILCAIGFFSGGAKSVHVGQEGVRILNDTKHTMQDLNLKTFQNLDFDIQNADVEFVQSDKYGIDICYYGDDTHMNYAVENNTLKVTDSEKNQINIFNFNLGFLYHRNVIKIYMPEKASLNDVKIANSCGDLRIGGFSAQTADIDCSCGNITMWDTTGKTLKVMNSCGNIDMKNITSDTIWAKDSSGNITMIDSTASKTDAIDQCGNIKFQNSKLGSASFDDHSGCIEAAAVITTQLNAKDSCGNMKFSGTLGGKSILDAQSGNIDFATSLSEKDYSYGLSASCGNIKVNGSKDAAHMKQNDDAANSITATNDCGDVHVNFQQ